MEVAGRTCCKLRFGACGWTANHMREFAVALPHFKQLKTLVLAENDLQDEGAKILATVLQAPFVMSIRGTVHPSVHAYSQSPWHRSARYLVWLTARFAR